MRDEITVDVDTVVQKAKTVFRGVVVKNAAVVAAVVAVSVVVVDRVVQVVVG